MSPRGEQRDCPLPQNFSHCRWPFYLVCIITILSQLFTAVMNMINSLTLYFPISREKHAEELRKIPFEQFRGGGACSARRPP
jgi:hypothetical protein